MVSQSHCKWKCRAYCNLGYSYEKGKVPKDERKAFELYSKAAQNGDDVGQCNVGACYQYAVG